MARNVKSQQTVIKPLTVKERKWFAALNTRFESQNRGEYFFFRDDDEGNIVFDIQHLRSAIVDDNIPFITVNMPITQDFYQFCLKSGEPDPEYVQGLTNSALKVPILAIVFSTGEHLLIDGNNRVAAAWLRKHPTLRMIIVGWPWWKPFSMWAKEAPLPPEFATKFLQMAHR